MHAQPQSLLHDLLGNLRLILKHADGGTSLHILLMFPLCLINIPIGIVMGCDDCFRHSTVTIMVETTMSLGLLKDRRTIFTENTLCLIAARKDVNQ